MNTGVARREATKPVRMQTNFQVRVLLKGANTYFNSGNLGQHEDKKSTRAHGPVSGTRESRPKRWNLPT